MKKLERIEVAVLLATYNGARFLEQQIRSLKENCASFTLYWLDDHSTDNTREVVRGVAQCTDIELRELHQPQHQGVPGTFFQLLEDVDADIYLFCDQDDIWQPGKIDAVVANLLPDVKSPVLCFSDVLMFRNDEPEVLYSTFDVLGTKPEVALKESRLFMPGFVAGNTQGFTRPLRDMFVAHKDIARTHAIMHDLWMYLIAVSSGTARMLPNVPTNLYRWHGNNATDAYSIWKGKGAGRYVFTWQQQQLVRRDLSRHARGFLLASTGLPPGQKLDRFVEIARLVATLDRRQSPAALLRLVRGGIMWANRRHMVGLAVACLCSDART
jgi:glycosyltransferase involved in cell wall biosynthesis